MNSPQIKYDSRLYEVKDCEILKDLTPHRRAKGKIYLCKCNICGNTFTRCRKTLVFHHSDCGCKAATGFRSGMYTDRLIMDMDMLSKRVMLAKIAVFKNKNLTDTFRALYIDKLPYSEYTALNMGMSMATLYRSRKKIHCLWTQLKNELMEK